jgi:hypothetical protein
MNVNLCPLYEYIFLAPRPQESKAIFSLHFLFSLHLATDLYRRALGGFECIVQRIHGQSNSAEHKAVDTFLG